MIDSLSFFGSYPFRRIPTRDLKDLIFYLSQKGFSRIYTIRFSSIFYRDPLEGNREALEELRSLRDKFSTHTLVRLIGGFNPLYIPQKRDLVRRALERDFIAYLVAPAYHGFRLDSRDTLRFIEIAVEENFRVLILDLLEDLREFHRGILFKYLVKRDTFKSFLEKIDKSFSKKIMLASFRYDLVREFSSRIADLEFFVDVSSDTFYGSQYDRVRELVESVGEDLVVLSSRTPLAYPEVSLYRVLYSDIDDSVKKKILYENPLKFYGEK